jgi:hypothetical protein
MGLAPPNSIFQAASFVAAGISKGDTLVELGDELGDILNSANYGLIAKTKACKPVATKAKANTTETSSLGTESLVTAAETQPETATARAVYTCMSMAYEIKFHPEATPPTPASVSTAIRAGYQLSAPFSHHIIALFSADYKFGFIYPVADR